MDRFSQFLTKRNAQFEKILRQLLPGSTPEQRGLILKHISEQEKVEEGNPPKIAVIGQAGVGKSSTINALFGTNLPVGHIGACTKEETELHVGGETIDGAKGTLIIYDMPGLGDDIKVDREEYRDLYGRVLGECDVAVWVINAASRAMAYDQMMLTEVLSPSQEKLLKRLVIGLNQIDLLQPGSWYHQANVPSKTQKETITKRTDYIVDRFRDIVPGLNAGRIIPYSAKQNYHLELLLEAMLNACPAERAWVLYGRRSIQDFKSMIDPELLEMAQQPNRR